MPYRVLLLCLLLTITGVVIAQTSPTPPPTPTVIPTPTIIPTFTPLDQADLIAPAVRRPEWLDTLNYLTSGLIGLTALIAAFNLLRGARRRRKG
ncbi:MAG: hypothetical protein MUF87_14630 [Anaerolineae bacterium]|jgi:hypothetical protein|nr:hypothetical protein [Anaerolineae bacterium]